MRKFGLIGFPLSHSFSKKYFENKWKKQGVLDHEYQLYELETIEDFPQLIASQPELEGLNVTIPYKQAVIPYLDELDPRAERIGAVNVIKFTNNKLKGFNSDYFGFQQSLLELIGKETIGRALVLGSGGASKAVEIALQDLNIEYQVVSRNSGDKTISYADLRSERLILSHSLIINTTPLGMFPEVDICPDLDYGLVGQNHYLFDLVYNPESTLFMKRGNEQEAEVKNGLQMLHLQADKAWEIWNS